MNPLENRAAEWLIRVLQQRHSPGGLYHGVKLWVRRGINLLSGSYLSFLAIYMLLVHFVGERQSGVAFFLYAPQQIGLLPLLVLLPLSLVISRTCFGLLVLSALFYAGPFMGFHWSRQRATDPSAPPITVIANNRGEDNRQSFTRYVQDHHPDFLVLQEDGRADAFRTAYPGIFAESQGGFTLVSRHPILHSGFLNLPGAEGSPVAAWFEVDYEHRPMVIYDVHLPTPRQDLASLRWGGIVWSMAGWVVPRLGARRQAEQAKWSARVALARELDAALQKETRPFIVAGDFNMPTWGYLHRIFGAHYHDSFAEAGRGWGFSFPGLTGDPLTLFGPWLRIDYVFGGRGFRTLTAGTEPARTSQHRCVIAQFAREPGS